MGVDIHEKRRLLGVADRNPAYLEKTNGMPTWARKKMEAQRARRRKYYYDYAETRRPKAEDNLVEAAGD